METTSFPLAASSSSTSLSSSLSLPSEGSILMAKVMEGAGGVVDPGDSLDRRRKRPPPKRDRIEVTNPTSNNPPYPPTLLLLPCRGGRRAKGEGGEGAGHRHGGGGGGGARVLPALGGGVGVSLVIGRHHGGRLGRRGRGLTMQNWKKCRFTTLICTFFLLPTSPFLPRGN